MYQFTVPEPLSYPSVGWYQLVTIMMNMPEELGWIEPDIIIMLGERKVTLVCSLSSGRTSVVFEGNLDGKSVVLKMAKNDSHINMPAFECIAQVSSFELTKSTKAHPGSTKYVGHVTIG